MLASVEAWAVAAEGEQRERIQRLPFSHMRESAQVVFSLVWAGGMVDEQRSRAEVVR